LTPQGFKLAVWESHCRLALRSLLEDSAAGNDLNKLKIKD